MKELKTSGLPIFWDEQGRFELRDGLKLQGTGHKLAEAMDPIVRIPGCLPQGEPYYDVYRGIMWPSDEMLFAKKNKRYDITAIMESPQNGECKKTSGHFHSYVPGTKISYPEVYEVLAGTALYILVRVKDHNVDPEKVEVEDIRLTVVHAGETIVIPPNYGHASINIGKGPMIFNNICTLENKSDYKIVKHYHGMPYYIVREEGKITVVKNSRWTMEIPEPRWMRVHENDNLGILFNNPVYNEFVKRPDTFGFLENPSGYVEEIMGMLEDM